MPPRKLRDEIEAVDAIVVPTLPDRAPSHAEAIDLVRLLDQATESLRQGESLAAFGAKLGEIALRLAPLAVGL